MKRSLPEPEFQKEIDALRSANREYARLYPGEGLPRQPVHTVYGGAQLFKAEAARKLGQAALKALDDYAPQPDELASALGWDLAPDLSNKIYRRVVAKLEREPLEDFRIDFEDGFGHRSPEEEDHHAVRTALEVARGITEGLLPPFFGIRIKPLSEELYSRSLRTLDLFVTTLAENSPEGLPAHFVVTLPKVPIPGQVSFLAAALKRLESKLGLQEHSLKLELMVELPQSILDHRGVCNLPLLLDASQGRCVAVHFGAYDYTAACQITADYQGIAHPACNLAKQLMQVALVGRGVWLSDGATHVLPVAPHRGSLEIPLSQVESEENRRVVHRAWRFHYRQVRHSLENGFYQGWDVHPGQLPSRYAAVFGFFQEGLEVSAERLRSLVEGAARASLVGEVFDDAASSQGLFNFFLRGVDCGAITPEEAATTGLTVEELQSRSLIKILHAREK